MKKEEVEKFREVEVTPKYQATLYVSEDENLGFLEENWF